MRLNDAITQLREALGLKVSYGLRAFVVYFIILGSLSWFLLGHAVERLNDGMRQAAENVMVDSVNLLAAMLEQQLKQAASNTSNQAITKTALKPDTDTLEKIVNLAKSRQFFATIYQVEKSSVSSDIYVTDSQGVVIYDSTGKHLGKDYSQWRDVNLTLTGGYGARTSFISPYGKTNDDTPKAMVVAAPIEHNKQTFGVVSLVTPIASLEQHLETETSSMRRAMLYATVVALFIGFLLSLLFSRSINKIAHYADKMANGETVETPKLLDQRLADLADSVANLRTQLDGKEYVEDYIHGLTHELKTPITGIQGAVELISEGLPEAEQKRFLDNIRSSNQRMERLVERMLRLAKLESQTELLDASEFDLSTMITRLTEERRHTLDSKGLTITINSPTPMQCQGDRVLISQAIGNLLDNAIGFATNDSDIQIQCKSLNAESGVLRSEVVIQNKGELIPEYAMPRIYERFFSLPSAVSSEAQRKSTGLGLSFVMEIMKLHRGNVVVKNHNSGVSAQLTWPD